MPPVYEGDDGESCQKYLHASESMLASIGKLLRKEYDKSAGFYITPEMSPLLSDVLTFVESAEDRPTLGLVFDLHLLLEGFRSSIWKVSAPQEAGCRLRAPFLCENNQKDGRNAAIAQS